MGRRAFVSPTVDGVTVVFEEQCDTQDDLILKALTKDMTQRFQCAGLAVLNHDDDILMYALFDGGKQVDEYNSNPGYFEGEARPPKGGDAEALCRLFGRNEAIAQVQEILREDSASELFVFAVMRHEKLMTALGLPSFGVGMGFTYLSRGEVPAGLSAGDLEPT